MSNFKKDIIKKFSLSVAFLFLLSSITYGETFNRCSLRVPVGSGTPERMQAMKGRQANGETSPLVEGLKDIFTDAAISPEKPQYNKRNVSLTLDIKLLPQGNSNNCIISVVPKMDYIDAFKDIDKILVVIESRNGYRKAGSFTENGTLVFPDMPRGEYGFIVIEPRDIRELYNRYEIAKLKIARLKQEILKLEESSMLFKYYEDERIALSRWERALSKILNKAMEIGLAEVKATAPWKPVGLLDEALIRKILGLENKEGVQPIVAKKNEEVLSEVGVVTKIPISPQIIERPVSDNRLPPVPEETIRLDGRKKSTIAPRPKRSTLERETLMKQLEEYYMIRDKLIQTRGDKENLELMDVVVRVEDGNTKYGVLFLYRINKSGVANKSLDYILVDSEGKEKGLGKVGKIYQIYFEQNIVEVERLRSMQDRALWKILRTVNSGL